MRKLNHQFEAQVWYDPEIKLPTPGQQLSLVVEDEDGLFVDIECYAGYVDTDGLIGWYNRSSHGLHGLLNISSSLLTSMPLSVV